MKKALIGLAAGTALTMAAGAANADGYGYGSVKDSPMIAPQVNWNGLYIGAAVGYGIASTEPSADFGGFIGGSLDGLSSEGFQGTVSLGYDRQIHPNVVLGIFGDYTFGDLETELSVSFGDLGADVGVFNISDSWAIGAKLGFVHTCCTMLYATAGYTHADLEAISLFSKSMDGWFIGGGIEHQLMNNIFLKLDYRYTDYGKVRWVDEDWIGINTDTDVHTVRLGVNWKVDLFGGRHAAHDALK